MQNEWECLKDLNIAKQTKCGYRGGKLRHKLLIPVCITQRSLTPLTRDNGVNHMNLAQIPVHHKTKC